MASKKRLRIRLRRLESERQKGRDSNATREFFAGIPKGKEELDYYAEQLGVSREEFITMTGELAEQFAARMGCNAPRPLTRIPEPWAQVADCHANVSRMVHHHGGRVVTGWQLALNSAERAMDVVFHSVWETPDGQDLCDITPQSEQSMALRTSGIVAPMPWFCEDPRYYLEYKVTETEHGLQGTVIRKKMPEHQGIRIPL